MQRLLCHFLLGAMILASGLAARVESAEPAPRFQRAINDYARLDKAGQARWIEDLFRKRAQPTIRLMLDALQRQQKLERYDAILRRISQGKQLSDAGLLTVLGEIDQQENAAIERLAREYRKITQQVLRQDRVELNRRLKVWEALQAEWQALGRPWEMQPKLIRWLQLAVMQERISPHPPLPTVPNLRESSDYSLTGRASVPPTSLTAPKRMTPPEPVRLSPRDIAMSLPRDIPAAPQLAPIPLPQPPKVASTPLQPSQRTDYQAARVIAPSSRSTQSTAPAPVTQPKPKIDLSDLTARVTGYNMSLADLLARLHGQQDWNVAQIDGAVEELTHLSVARRDLDLYWKLLSPEARAGVAKIEPSETAISLLAAKVSARRRHLASAIAEPATLEQTREGFALDRISHRLARLAVQD